MTLRARAAWWALYFALLFWAALSSGCATAPDSGRRWWSPGTWFSARPAAVVARNEARADAARETTLRDAQREAVKTTLALAVAPPSREVEIATRTAGNAAALLDQANGPLPLAELDALRRLVSDLRAENAELRTAAEREQTVAEKRAAAHSAALSDVRTRLDASQAKLAAAYARENRLANRWRNLVAGTVILAAVLLLAVVGLVWFRLQTMGLRTALSGALRDGDAAGLGDTLRRLLDPHLNRAEQSAIRSAVVGG